MTGLGSAMISGLSALRAAQQSLGVASQNIANANTPGYVRTDVTLAPSTNFGFGGGVEVSSIKRAADQFLATASYIAEAARGSASARSDILARAQASFGDPTSTSSMFSSLDDFWSKLTELGVDPSSTLRRDDAVSALQTAYSEIGRVGNEIQTLVSETDQRVAEAVGETQTLLNRIASLNQEIQLTARSGADSSAAENAQSQLVDQLSAIMDIRVTPQSEGGVAVRTSGGALLVGVSAAQISYTASSAPFGSHGVIQLNSQLGSSTNLEPFLSGGTLSGLLQARDKDLPGLAEALGSLAAELGDALNEVHNENSSSPPVRTLTGRQTGLLATDALNFTGKAVIGVADQSGNLSDRVQIDFGAGTITTSVGTYNFNNVIGDSGTANSFVAQLDTALGALNPAGSAEFANGVLTVSAGAGGGLAVQQDAATPSDRAGRGFSQFFGLNDLVSRPTPMFFETGASGTDLHGLTSGGQLSFTVRDTAGRYIASPTVTISGALAGATSTWDDLITALNSTTTGVGQYGSFALDSTTGRITFTPGAAYQVELTADSTSRGGTGVSFSALNGLTSAATAGRAVEVNVASAIAADPGRLAVGRPDLTVPIGSRMVESGDNRGATALLNSRDTTRTIAAAGVLSAQSSSIALYISRLGGEAGRMATDAQRAASGAEAISTAASDRRAQIEGVNIDDEMLKMTTYQNAYAAAARVIQAATQMYDILLTLGTTTSG
jgi:flagellar hook-associated protein 1